VNLQTISFVRQRWTGFCFALASALFFSFLNVAVRYSEPYLDVWQIMFARSVFGALVMLLVAHLSRVSLRGAERKTMLLIGVTSVINVLCLTAAIFLLPLFEALVLLYLYPVFAALISPLINGDRFGGSDWGFIVLGLAGTVLVLWPGELHSQLSGAHLLALGAAFSYGLTTTLIRRVARLNNPLIPFFYICLVGAIVCALPALGLKPLVNLPLAGWVGLFALCLFGLLAYLASIKALQYLSSPRVGVISMAEVLFSSLFGLWFFHEHLGSLALTGGALIMVSGLLLSIKPLHRQPAKAVV
jgi:drug/metabolite transporter (DMT)-like permease